MTDPRSERDWERGWEGHADAQASRMAALSLAEKLDWLEEAHARVLHMQKQQGHPAQVRERRDETTDPPREGPPDSHPAPPERS